MSEPDFIERTIEPLMPAERRRWLHARAAAMRAEGAVWFQASIENLADRRGPVVTVIEGWRARPPEPAREVLDG